jgi:hypothetical protein
MPATPSLANMVLGGIAACLVASQFLSVVTSTDTDDGRIDRGRGSSSTHGHKGDRLALFHAQEPSVTVAAPSVRLFGAPEADSGDANITVALKNVVVVAKEIDIDALAAPHLLAGAPDQGRTPQSTLKSLRCKVAPARDGVGDVDRDVALGRLAVRCLA